MSRTSPNQRLPDRDSSDQDSESRDSSAQRPQSRDSSAQDVAPRDPPRAEPPLDVAIVGAGPVGMFLAVLLAQEGLSIALLEQRAEPGTHSRAIGIHPPSLEVLAGAGLAQPLLAEAVKIRSATLRSQGRTLGSVSFARVSDDYPFVAALAQHRTEFFLAERLAQLAPGALRRGVQVTGMEQGQHAVRLHGTKAPAPAAGTPAAGALGSGGQASSAGGRTWVDARIVIGADGARSLTRSAAGIRTRISSHKDTYLMGDFADTTADGEAAVIWLEPGGVVESFPLSGGIRRWVVRTPALQPNATADQLCRLIRERTGLTVAAETNSMLSAFDVRSQLALTMTTGRTVLIGDAAHEVSPIGGQGMNLGWLDAAAIAPVLADAAAAGRLDTRRLERIGRRRMRAASVAGRHAQLNMVMGRPAAGRSSDVRSAAVRLLLASPARPLLAGAYSMRWL